MIHRLDTNILIVLIQRRPPQVAERIDTLAEDDSLAMSFITWAELLQGAEGSQRLDAVLVSHDVPEFRRIEGLRLVDWATSP
ncbi:MAG: PIN domain-containing protein [Cyanobium sp.]